MPGSKHHARPPGERPLSGCHPKFPARTSLQALTSAALVLPGLGITPVHAADSDQVSLQFNRYEESKRDLIDISSDLDPLVIDTLRFNADLSLGEGRHLSFGLTQDTWSGATPVTTSPLAAHGNRAILENLGGSVITTGASPYVNGQILLDDRFTPLVREQGLLREEARNVLVMSSASPEARDRIEVAYRHELDALTLQLDAGLSHEQDYRSRFAGFGLEKTLNDRLTTLTAGGSYHADNIRAILDDDLLPYLTRTAYATQLVQREGSEVLYGDSRGWSAAFSLAQVLNRNAVLEFNLGYNDTRGFLENPYKAVTVVFAGESAGPVTGDVRALLEQRPDRRRETGLSGKLVHYIAPFDAALHLEYRYTTNDWGIDAHTLTLDWIQPLGGGWSLTPRLRYYTQDAVDFYQPWLVSAQDYRRLQRDESGREIWLDPAYPDRVFARTDDGGFADAAGNAVDAADFDLRPAFVDFDPALLPRHFASDHRLAGFGSISGGFTLNKQVSPMLSFEAGFEYYQRKASLGSGSGQEKGFADFDYWMANAGLSFGLGAGNGMAGHNMSGQSAGAMTHRHHPVPAGLMFAHMPARSGALMTGYQYRFSRRRGDMLNGDSATGDASIVAAGCGADPCRFVPTYMDMQMHMFHFMYAPTDSYTLVLMPQYMEMDMDLRNLAGRPPPQFGVHEHTGLAGHATGAVGDTLFGALFRLYDDSRHHVHAGVMLSAPTGKTDLAFRRMFKADGGLTHFGMQTGSGTWDLLPSLTWSGAGETVFWGAQLSATARLENSNSLGYRLGNAFQASGWAGYQINPAVSASVRGSFRDFRPIDGDLNRYSARLGPMDFPANQGGEYWDLGLNLSLNLQEGPFAGNTLSLEWEIPVHDDVNGFQLERQHSITASWSLSL